MSALTSSAPGDTLPSPRLAPLKRHSVRALRIVAALAVFGAAIFLFVRNDAVRHVEAVLASALLDPIVDGGSFASQDAFLVWVTDERLVAFRVTVECTILVILLPLLGVSSMLLGVTRLKAWRIASAMLAMLGVLVVINVIRLGFIGWASQTWGMEIGYPLSHTFIGSAIGLIGFAAGTATLILIAGGRFTRRKRAAA